MRSPFTTSRATTSPCSPRPASAGPSLELAERARRGDDAAVIGYPENGPLTFAAARLGRTGTVISEDSYGRGPVRRRMTPFRADVRSGNSGGPVVDDRRPGGRDRVRGRDRPGPLRAGSGSPRYRRPGARRESWSRSAPAPARPEAGRRRSLYSRARVETASAQSRADRPDRRSAAGLPRLSHRDRARRPSLGRGDPLDPDPSARTTSPSSVPASPGSPTGCSRAGCASSRSTVWSPARCRQGNPPRVSYSLTEKGHALEPALAALQDWARSWKLSS